MVNPNHITPYGEISENERELADDLVFNRREDALERFIAHFESKGEEDAAEAEDPTEGMEPEEALHWHILRRKKDGVEEWIDRSVEKIGAVPTLNQVLLPAMKEVGDKFGAGELILPFVLQSAEVMKRAVAQLENYLDRIEGHTKGKVVIATVFGDVHDIGKSLVNTILTNNGYTVVDLGKQVPIDTIIDAAVEHEADAIGLSALLVSTSKQMPACIQELHAARARVPGADRRRGDQPRLRPPRALPARQGVRRGLRAGRLLLQGRLRGPRHRRRAGRRGGARVAGREDPRRGPGAPREAGGRRRLAADHRRLGALGRRRTDDPIPEPPFWGVREVDVDLDEVYPYLDRHVLFKLHWGGRGKKGEEWRRIVEGHDGDEGFAPKLERMWREQDYLQPARAARLLPLQRRRQRAGDLRPRRPRPRDRAAGLPAPAQARPDLPGRLLPARSTTRRAGRRRAAGGHGRRRGHRADRRSSSATASSPSSCSSTGSASRRPRDSPSGCTPRSAAGSAIELDQGRRYSWGYPACPDQSEHEKVERLLGISEIGIALSGGYALEPEQSTAAIIAHHPQAVYFGMKSGFVPAEKKGDELIAGTERGGELPPDADPEGDGTIEAETDARAADPTTA